MKTDISSMYFSELQNKLASNGFPKYRATQIFDWLSKNAKNFSDMHNLPQNLRQYLTANYYICVLSIEKKLKSMYDSTVKYLFKLGECDYIEAVVMKYKHGYSMCISTQVGCKMNCSFCATGKQGFKRNLTAGEMIAQIKTAQEDLNIRISNIVLMGMGEPLDNYDNVTRFLQKISSQETLNIGMRHITVSTCGIADKIYALANLNFQITLSISLHAPNDLLRSKLMPINKAYPIDTLIKACKYYQAKTNRRITFEYTMIDNVNDGLSEALQLAKLLNGMLCHVNLIPVNSVKNSEYQKSSDKKIDMFISELAKHNIVATRRRTLGSDIDASCGQLKQKFVKSQDEGVII